MKHFILLLMAAFLLCQPLSSQIRIVATEQLPLDPAKEWALPQFSPDGSRIYLTVASYDGIWEYDAASHATRCLTTDRSSGFGFAVSADGRQLAYRRNLESNGPERRQEIVLLNLLTGQSSTLSHGADLSAPVFIRSSVAYSSAGTFGGAAAEATTSEATLLGIERTKILLHKGGANQTLDPLGDGSYIWPSLSPDRTKLVAYDMNRGTFVCSLDGSGITMLGRRDAPSWTRSGKWLVYMKDLDDGQRILGSELCAVSPDGKTETTLTSTNDRAEMFPNCSPAANSIVCSTLDGRILVLTYEEVAR